MVWIPNSTAPRRCDRQRSLGAQGAAYVIVSSLLLGGCQTTDGEVPISEIFGKQYNVFYDQSDHVKGLLQRDEALEASSVYTAEAAFFAGKGKAQDELLGSLRAEVEARYEVDSGPVMEELEATKWPAPPTEWSGIKSNLARAEDLIDELQGHAILSWQNQSPLIVRLDKQASTLRRQIERSAGQQLVAYGFLTDPAFADIYPIEVDMSVTLASVSDELGEALSQAGPNDLIELHARYRYQIPATITSGLAERYVATATAERVEAGDSWLEARILALKAAAAHNLTLSAPVKAEFRAIDISSPTGTGERFDFPVLVTTELPIAFEKTTEKDAI